MGSFPEGLDLSLTPEAIVELQLGTPDGPDEFPGYHFHEKYRAHDRTQMSIYPELPLTNGAYFQVPNITKRFEDYLQ
jgi:hypothetical protein